jgi:hypothetical protein
MVENYSSDLEQNNKEHYCTKEEFNEFIEDEEYHLIPVLYGEEPKLIILTSEMEKLVSYTLYHHNVD